MLQHFGLSIKCKIASKKASPRLWGGIFAIQLQFLHFHLIKSWTLVGRTAGSFIVSS